MKSLKVIIEWRALIGGGILSLVMELIQKHY